MKTRIVVTAVLALLVPASAGRAEPGGGKFWDVLGNSGTDPAINFLGTTDNQPLVIGTNGSEAVRVNASGAVGIGTAEDCPSSETGCKLRVVGATSGGFAGAVVEVTNTGTNGVGVRSVGEIGGVVAGSFSADGIAVDGIVGLHQSGFGLGVRGFGNHAGVNAIVRETGLTAVLAQAVTVGSDGPQLFMGQVIIPSGDHSDIFTRARIDNSGKGFFDGGTQMGGADFAESVDVAGDRASYGPGDVLIIDAAGSLTMRTTAEPYSTSIAGIYSLKPGVLATTRSMEDPRLMQEVPLAIVGIVPCKVSAENGAIAPGDLLVTSSTSGHAMKGTDRGRMLGAMVGKALEPLRLGTGVIRVLVTLQ